MPYDKTGTTLLSAWDVSIPAASKNQELAWEWVKMYTSAESRISSTMILEFFHQEKHSGREMESKEHIWIPFVRLLIQQISGGEFQLLQKLILC
ncbi:MAG: hypothetical protein ACLSGB_12935 [Dorea sp.]